MLLESSYDLAFIDEEFVALQDYFEIFGDFEDVVTEKKVNERVMDACVRISMQHKSLYIYDMDSIVEMLCTHFLPQVKSILPERFNLGGMLWTKSNNSHG